MYKMINPINLSINLVKATLEVETAPTFHFVCPECKTKPTSKKFCETHGEIKPIKEMLVEIPEDKNIEIVGFSKVNPLELKNYYYCIPTKLKGAKLVNVNKSKLYTSVYNYLIDLKQGLLVKTWFNSKEYNGIVFAYGNYLMFSVLSDLKEKPLIEHEATTENDIKMVDLMLEPYKREIKKAVICEQ